MNFPHILYGGDYNPDQWPEAIWREDARLMQEAGVNLVSLGIFSWVKLEPQPGVFDFGWLDQLLDLLHAHGVAVNLATPTAAPPAWMVRLHPDLLPITAEGVTLWHGSRRHYCAHNPHYLHYANRIAAQLAARYQQHPALAMWHVDNEYGGECHCENSAHAFREWLARRYTTLAALNAAWGTAFWSQSYGAWAEIATPRRAPTGINPSQQLDWARFNSDSWLACFEAQRTILHAATPHIPITTNFMGFHKGTDYFKFAAREDVVSQDSYPETHEADWMAKNAMTCDLIRSVGARRPWILMEQAPSQVNWRQRNTNKRPGIMRLGSLQAVARGADGVMFFQWRQSQAGSEKHHSAMVPHAGTNSRAWREVKALGAELRQLTALLASPVEAAVAIVMDWENWWALELDSKPSNDLKLIPQIYAYYKPLFDRNITVDFVHPEADLTRYQLVIAPNLYLVTDRAADNLNRYVENGGTVVMSFFSGMVDENEHIRLGGYPAPFRHMLGLTVEEYAPYPVTQTNAVRTATGQTFTATLWADVIALEGAEALAVFTDDYYANGPALTRHRFGKGRSFYVGTELDAAGLTWLLDLVCAEVGLQPVLQNLPAGVEAVRRAHNERSWLFLLNHTGAEISFPLEITGRDLLTGAVVATTLTLAAHGVAVVEV